MLAGLFYLSNRAKGDLSFPCGVEVARGKPPSGGDGLRLEGKAGFLADFPSWDASI